MPTQSITLNNISPQPLPTSTSGGQAQITFTYTGNYTGTITVYAAPVGGGTPVALGSVTISQTSGNQTYVRLVNLDTSGLDPNTNYEFYAQGGGITSNELGPFDVVPCFAEGTLIATARGEVPVERLRVGDLVVVAQGMQALQPVVWLGHARVDVAGHRQPHRVAPVCIRAGALGDGMPHRDLRVSPDHGILIEGALVPAGLVVNGTTVVQEMWCPQVTYWHVELSAHALLVAEGAVAESYLDDGNRAQFDNHAITALLKDFSPELRAANQAARTCCPLVLDGIRLERARARIAARVQAPGRSSAGQARRTA